MLSDHLTTPVPELLSFVNALYISDHETNSRSSEDRRQPEPDLVLLKRSGVDHANLNFRHLEVDARARLLSLASRRRGADL